MKAKVNKHPNRISIRPCGNTLKQRSKRAMYGVPSYQKRKDIVNYIKHLKHMTTLAEKIHRSTINGIRIQTSNLLSFDYRFAGRRANFEMKRMKMKDSYTENLAVIIKSIRSGTPVVGFEIMRTNPKANHPTFIQLMEIGDGMSLCVRKTANVTLKQNRMDRSGRGAKD